MSENPRHEPGASSRPQTIKMMRGFKTASVIVGMLFPAVTAPFLAGLYPTVRFPRERIDVHISPDRAEVRGTYIYQNPFPFPVVQAFRYPVPTDDLHRGAVITDKIPMLLFCVLLLGAHNAQAGQDNTETLEDAIGKQSGQGVRGKA